MGQPWPLLLAFCCKAFYSNDLQTGHSIETFPHKLCSLYGLISAHGRESWLGVTVCLLALQDGEITIIAQTNTDTVFLCWSFVKILILRKFSSTNRNVNGHSAKCWFLIVHLHKNRPFAQSKVAPLNFARNFIGKIGRTEIQTLGRRVLRVNQCFAIPC